MQPSYCTFSAGGRAVAERSYVTTNAEMARGGPAMVGVTALTGDVLPDERLDAAKETGSIAADRA